MRITALLAFTILAAAGLTAPVAAFPQYAQWISKHSGSQVDCAYCHINASGPLGSGQGQEASLSKEELAKMHTADSPVLNDFGKSLIRREGLDKVMANIATPEVIVADMKAYDLDGDGISDGAEMEHGTLADDPLSAPPSMVWQVRLRRDLPFVLLVLGGAGAAALGLVKLARLAGD